MWGIHIFNAKTGEQGWVPNQGRDLVSREEASVFHGLETAARTAFHYVGCYLRRLEPALADTNLKARQEAIAVFAEASCDDLWYRIEPLL